MALQCGHSCRLDREGMLDSFNHVEAETPGERLGGLFPRCIILWASWRSPVGLWGATPEAIAHPRLGRPDLAPAKETLQRTKFLAFPLNCSRPARPNSQID